MTTVLLQHIARCKYPKTFNVRVELKLRLRVVTDAQII